MHGGGRGKVQQRRRVESTQQKVELRPAPVECPWQSRSQHMLAHTGPAQSSIAATSGSHSIVIVLRIRNGKVELLPFTPAVFQACVINKHWPFLRCCRNRGITGPPDRPPSPTLCALAIPIMRCMVCAAAAPPFAGLAPPSCGAPAVRKSSLRRSSVLGVTSDVAGGKASQRLHHGVQLALQLLDCVFLGLHLKQACEPQQLPSVPANLREVPATTLPPWVPSSLWLASRRPLHSNSSPAGCDGRLFSRARSRKNGKGSI